MQALHHVNPGRWLMRMSLHRSNSSILTSHGSSCHGFQNIRLVSPSGASSCQSGLRAMAQSSDAVQSAASAAAGLKEHMAHINSAQAIAGARPPRFYVSTPLSSSTQSSLRLEDDESRHAYVLRLKAGDQLELCDGLGWTQHCEISVCDKAGTSVYTLAQPVYHAWEGPAWVVAVGCTTLKGSRCEWLVEKCTELGAVGLIPFTTERSQGLSKNKFKSGKNDDGDEFQVGRLQRVAVAGTKQSLRTHGLQLHPVTPLPLISQLKAFRRASGQAHRSLGLVAVAGAAPLHEVLAQWQREHAVNHVPTAATQAVQETRNTHQATREEEQRTLPHAALGRSDKSSDVSENALDSPVRMLFIGPEGDFTPAELELLLQAGVRPVGLGPHRLRTETAAVALLAAVLFHGGPL